MHMALGLPCAGKFSIMGTVAQWVLAWAHNETVLSKSML